MPTLVKKQEYTLIDNCYQNNYYVYYFYFSYLLILLFYLFANTFINLYLSIFPMNIEISIISNIRKHIFFFYQ